MLSGKEVSYTMQRLFNSPEDVVNESIIGFVKVHRDIVAHTSCARTLKYKLAPIDGKVGVVSGGGAGHDPAFMGYLGKNMLDAVAIGDIFSPPQPEAFYTAFKEADSGKGVVCIYGNYPEDTKSVNEAIELARQDGITVVPVVVNEDVADLNLDTRRGLTGEVLLWKIGAAAAAKKYSLESVVEVSNKALGRMRSIGIGLSSCTVPEVGHPSYLIEPGTMEIGVGHHGFSSKDTCKLRPASVTADIMLDEIQKDLALADGENVAVMVSGLGGTMKCELDILYSRIFDLLQTCNVNVYRSFVGNYFTSLDMLGVTLTIMRLNNELAELIDLPAYPIGVNGFA